MSRLSRSTAVFALVVGLAVSRFAGPAESQQVEQAVCPELRVAASIDTLLVRCAQVTVPQARGDRASADLAPVRLPVVIFSRSETNWKATPVLYLTGGPGESAIDDVAGNFLATPTGWALVRERPIIAFDQRGFGTQSRDSDPWIGGLRRAQGDTAPLHPRQLQSLLVSAAAGLRRDGVDLRNFDTVEAAADAVDVLRVLGLKRAILYGTSYGTRVALQILRDNADLIEAVVLDGVVPPQATGAFQLDSVNGYRRRALEKLVKDCHADARCRAMYPTISRDLGRLTRAGATMDVHMRDARTGMITPATVAGQDIAAAMGGYLIMEEFRVAAPGILAELGHGRLTVDSHSGVVPAALRLASRVSTIPEYGLAYLSVVCAESPTGIEQYGGSAMCNALGVPFAGRTHTAPVSSDVPALLIGSRYDASSPPEWADLAARTLRRGHVVHMPGTGHVATSQPHSAECVMEVVLEFVHDPARAPAARCVESLGLPDFPGRAIRAGGPGDAPEAAAHPQDEPPIDVDVTRAAVQHTGARQADRPRIGIALGGGSAKGIAHVGVLRWFEEHHIPIDVLAGTSMGGLVGGAFAAGMTPAEIEALIDGIDWDQVFGASSFQFRNVRQKQDARDFPARLEFGVRGGIVPPVALNNGQGVELLIARIAGRYGELRTFDELPTPFRSVAVDLLSAEAVVFEDGFLGDAMRATMSLPGVFPPVEWRGRILVDGGAFDNVPADVVRGMGADVVIAVRVGDAGAKQEIDYSISGVAEETVDAMMHANTQRAIESADVVINPELTGYGGMDWRSAEAIVEQGYRAAEAMRDVLLPLAVDEWEWEEYVAERARRRSTPPVPMVVRVADAAPADTSRILGVLRRYVGAPLDVDGLERDLIALAGLNRYEAISWALVRDDGDTVVLLARARSKRHAPPYLMLGSQLSNATSGLFRFHVAARYLAFDVAGRGSELRVDGALGTEPRLGVELFRPFGSGPFFGAAAAGVRSRDLYFVSDGAVIAQYEERRIALRGDLGIEPGRADELRLGLRQGHLRRSERVGDPRLPEASGWETQLQLLWRHDSQDRAVVPSRGIHAATSVTHLLAAPDADTRIDTDRSNEGLTQASTVFSVFFSPHARNRVFILAGGGTSFGDNPLPSEQFQLGGPLRLGAYHPGELRDDHFLLATAGYLWAIGRLPDFFGGPVFVGAWLENGTTFDDIADAQLATSLGAGGILDTLLGPLMLAVSVGDNGEVRPHVSIGGIF